MDRRNFISSIAAGIAGGFLPLHASASSARMPVGYIRTNWSQDPFSYGSYSFYAKGSSRRDAKHLATSVEDKVFFAGEATHPKYNSTVHAAFESGEMAAKQISKTNPNTVGIIGAGISGLSAAYQLSKAGLDVTVLEARDRIGGRIETNQSMGVPLDLGASWIHGHNGNPITKLARKAGAKTIETDFSYLVRGGDGRTIPDNQAPDWLDGVTEIEHNAGASLSELNVTAYLGGGDYEGDELIFPNGYSQVFNVLKGDYSVETNVIVEGVDYSSSDIAVATSKGLRNFDAVLVTVPLGVLKQGKIRFTPDLPNKKRAAISSMGMGVLDKVYLKYDQVFWDRDRTWIATPENGLPQGQFNSWLNLAKYIDQPVIMAFNAASSARQLAKLTDKEVLRRALQTLDRAYPI